VAPAFPPIGRTPFSAEQLETLDRFVAAVKELGESAVLNGKHRLTVNMLEGGSESVEAEFPKGENLRGLSVLCRQFYSDDEVASFTSARKALGEVCAQLEDSDRERRLEELRTWRKAHGRMRGTQLEMLVLEQMVRDERVPASALDLKREGPNYLITIYNYGEPIHFGDQRARLKEIVGGGPFEENWSKMEFLTTMTSFCHLYVGFATLIEATCSKSNLGRLVESALEQTLA
jgi:hypothetical protein